jgi:hypothetical protein
MTRVEYTILYWGKLLFTLISSLSSLLLPPLGGNKSEATPLGVREAFFEAKVNILPF